MKIIKEGSLPSERIHRASCSNGGSIIEFKEGEANRKHSSDPREPESWWEVRCPLTGCGSMVRVYDNASLNQQWWQR